MEAKVGQWYYNPPSSEYDEGWTRITDISKNRYGENMDVIEWDTYVMRDGMFLRISAEELPKEIAFDPGVKIRKATGKELGLLISRIFQYSIEIADEYD